MYELEIYDVADRKFTKLANKNRVLLEAISKKTDQIKKNPEHFKPLRSSMKGERRI